jgi:DNA-binding transcriptional MerR regulator
MQNTDLFPAMSTGAAPSVAKASTPEEAPVTPGITVDEIPDKLYFRIGEVARLAGIKPYVLRFWETEFPGLGPKKSGTGHRLYRRKDVQMVLDIKTLLYEKRYTIEGARKHLESRPKVAPLPDITPKKARGTAKVAEKKVAAKGQVGLFDVPGAAMDSVRKELNEILKLLK